MKRLTLAAVTILAFGAAGCGSKSTTAPSTTTIFTVQLSALNEVPAVSNAEATARGTAVITIDSAKNTIDFAVSLNGFTPTSAVNIAHIHGPNAPAGTTASVLVSTTLTAGNVTLTNGAGTFSFPQIGASAATISSILAAPQNFYFNVHTTLNPGGAIRGQLQ